MLTAVETEGSQFKSSWQPNPCAWGMEKRVGSGVSAAVDGGAVLTGMGRPWRKESRGQVGAVSISSSCWTTQKIDIICRSEDRWGDDRLQSQQHRKCRLRGFIRQPGEAGNERSGRK